MASSDTISFGCSFILFVLVLFGGCAMRMHNQITISKSKPKITRLLGTTDYTIVDQSNNSIITGTPTDVTYNIKVDSSGIVVSCRCTNSFWQPLICRKYQ